MFRSSILIVAGVILIGLCAATHSPLHAQSCHSDVQCNGGQSRTSCAGNTLVTARSVCAGGQCQTVETSRVACSNACLADRCIDGTPGPRREGSSPSQVEARCLPGCSCRNNRLVLSTGRWSVQAGCEQRVRRCQRGCTCDDIPRCL